MFWLLNREMLLKVKFLGHLLSFWYPKPIKASDGQILSSRALKILLQLKFSSSYQFLSSVSLEKLLKYNFFYPQPNNAVNSQISLSKVLVTQKSIWSSKQNQQINCSEPTNLQKLKFLHRQVNFFFYKLIKAS